MIYDDKFLLLKSYRKITKEKHKMHLKTFPRTRSWYKKCNILKKKRSLAKRNFVHFKRKWKHVKKYRESICKLQCKYNKIQVMINKNIDTMYNSLENISTCSNHSSVQDFLRQAISSYVREQPNRFQTSLTHVWAYDNSSRQFNTLDVQLEDCQNKIDIQRIKLNNKIKEFD